MVEPQLAAFFAAYDAVLAAWPVPHEAIEIPSSFGTTRVNACGPVDGTPLVLLPAGGATSTVWFANVADLSRDHRVYAVDLIGDPGRSLQHGRRVATRDDLVSWLDGLVKHLDIKRFDLCGHSYGGWIALNYAVHAPQRVRRLALLDPTRCFAPYSPRYLLRALPLLVRPTPQRSRALLDWETGSAGSPSGSASGAPAGSTWRDVVALGTGFPKSTVVKTLRPEAEQLRACTVPTLLVLAERSRAHNIDRVRRNAQRLMPQLTTAVLPGATHHSIPAENPEPLDRQLREFFEPVR